MAATIAFEVGATIQGLDDALRLVEAARRAGADAYKVQILDPETLVGNDVPVTYGTPEGPVTESMLAILRRRVLTDHEWVEVSRTAQLAGLGFIATVDGERTLRLALDLGATHLKVCSGDVNHLAWVRAVAATRRPVMLDTGHASLDEILEAVEAAQGAGAAEVLVCHCPSGYPAGLGSINLRMIPTLQRLFGACRIGFSDHSPGRDMSLAAIALGVDYVEKTLTLDYRIRSPEHVMSVEPDEARAFVAAVRDLERALGEPARRVTPEERLARASARRSAYTTSALAAGALLGPATVAWRRPGGGIEPHEASWLYGSCLRHALPMGHRLAKEDLA